MKAHWSSHLPVLVKVLRVTDGPVLELGMGIHSTPFLHWMCAERKRLLVSYESKIYYLGINSCFKNELHQMHLVEDWDKIDIEKSWDVAFIDHEAERREIDIKRLANYAKYLVVHDTQTHRKGQRSYGYDDVFPLFKYQRDFTFATAWTSVLSNFKDLSNLK